MLPMRPLPTVLLRLRSLWLVGMCCLLAACASVRYTPLATIDRVQPEVGYRLRTAVQSQTADRARADDLFVVMMFSGGGSRAAALGYGVLKEMRRQQFVRNGETTDLSAQVDLTFGISGGSMLSAAWALEGPEIFQTFEPHFLKQDIQRNIVHKVFSVTNWSRLSSPEFGRGDLLEEQLDLTLFQHATFGDLASRRKGPFSVISATDMSTGSRLDFIQENFDVLCLNLSKLPVARAVAASSAVPLVFAPVTLNNHGGHCHYTLPEEMQQALFLTSPGSLEHKTRMEIVRSLTGYDESRQRPYIHLLDGGLVDNLGMRGLLDATQLYSSEQIYDQFTLHRARRIVVISVNAQNRPASVIDQSAAVPPTREVVQALVNIPIDRNSQESLRQFRRLIDHWRAGEQARARQKGETPVDLYFISLDLADLPDAAQRRQALNIPTSLYLPPAQINLLEEAGSVLLRQSSEFQRLQKDLSLTRS
ncbi:patatin-like phospholipase family protein [Brachymonas sp.]|uniref:patatin-like phospholipase family protein n=1 Tax=Brachymonas sp. TaxID=1936292 RepID=UPI0035AE3A2D